MLHSLNLARTLWSAVDSTPPGRLKLCDQPFGYRQQGRDFSLHHAPHDLQVYPEVVVNEHTAQTNEYAARELRAL